MAAVMLDGATLARRIREGLAAQVQAFTQRAGRPPGLALVLVGDDPASQVYVGRSGRRAARSDFASTSTSGRLPRRSTSC